MKMVKVYETRGLNKHNVVKIFEHENYYAIESFMAERNPAFILSRYEYSKLFPKKTKWDWDLLIFHGHLEANGIIKPIQ